MDEPPETGTIFKQLSAQQQQDLFKWTKNFDFLKWIVILLFAVFAVDTAISVFYPDADCTLTESLFETLRSILLMASGYVFAKSKDT